MKKYFFLVLCLFPVFLSAGEFSLKGEISSQYIGKNGGIFYDRPVLQIDFFSKFSPFYVDLWTSTGLNDIDLSSNYGDEVDVTLGVAPSFREKKKWGYDVGLCYVDVYKLGLNREGEDILNPFIKISRSGTYQYSLTGEYYFPVDSLPGSEGPMFHLNVGRTFLKEKSTQIPLGLGIVWDPDGLFGFDEGVLAKMSLGLESPLNEKLSMRLGYLGIVSLEGADNRDGKSSIQLGFSYSF